MPITSQSIPSHTGIYKIREALAIMAMVISDLVLCISAILLYFDLLDFYA